MENNISLIFSTTNYKYLADSISEFQNTQRGIHFKHGLLERKIFPDGESYHQMQGVKNSDCIIIGGTYTDSETLELYDIACHIMKTGAKSLTIVIPYFGYSTMERAVKPGEIVKAKTRARLLSSIPTCGRLKIVFMDLHSEGILHYIEGNIETEHLYSKEVIIKMCQEISSDSKTLYYKNKNFVLASTDAGRAKWVESLANDMGVDCAIITKRRISGTDTEIAGINADVKGKNVVIYDDMIRTGGSLIKAGQAYKDAGALNVYAVATHGVLPDNSIFKLAKSGIFKAFATTDTHPRANILINSTGIRDFYPDFYKVYSINELLYNYFLNLNNYNN